MIDSNSMIRLVSDLSGVELTTDPVQCERYSHDFSWFSPVLKKTSLGKGPML